MSKMYHVPEHARGNYKGYHGMYPENYGNSEICRNEINEKLVSKAKKEYYYKGDSCNKAGFYNEDHFVIAAMNGHLDFCKAFLEGGVDIKIVTKRGTALELAARGCYPELCKLLIEHGAEVNLRNQDNETPLMLAVESAVGRAKSSSSSEKYSLENAIETCKLLIQYGADIHVGSRTNSFVYNEGIDLLRKHGLIKLSITELKSEEKNFTDLIHSETVDITHNADMPLVGEEPNQDNSGSIWSWCTIL